MLPRWVVIKCINQYMYFKKLLSNTLLFFFSHNIFMYYKVFSLFKERERECVQDFHDNIE